MLSGRSHLQTTLKMMKVGSGSFSPIINLFYFFKKSKTLNCTNLWLLGNHVTGHPAAELSSTWIYFGSIYWISGTVITTRINHQRDRGGEKAGFGLKLCGLEPECKNLRGSVCLLTLPLLPSWVPAAAAATASYQLCPTGGGMEKGKRGGGWEGKGQGWERLGISTRGTTWTCRVCLFPYLLVVPVSTASLI